MLLAMLALLVSMFAPVAKAIEPCPSPPCLSAPLR